MNLEEAIKTAIDYETRIRDIYLEGAGKIDEKDGNTFFEALGKDEQGHLDYLRHQLEHWLKQGELSKKELQRVPLPAAKIKEDTDRLSAEMAREDRGLYQQMLSKALHMELRTSRFYRELVDTMPAESGAMFARFLEIEEEHVDAVQIRLDYEASTGYWMGTKEFDME